MSRVGRDKYFPPSGNDFVDEILRRNENLTRRVSDLERALANQDTPQPIPRINPETYPDPYEGQRAIDITDEQHTWYSDGEWRKAAGGGVGVYEIKVFEDQVVIVAGDDKFDWEIPEDLDQAEIIKVEGFVSTPSSSGSIQVQLRKLVNGVPTGSDILTNKITIEANERNSKDAAVQPSITGGTVTVSHGDHIRVDVDAAGTSAKGLGIIVVVTPSPLGSVTLQGATGPAGGITAWKGQWATSTSYVIGDAVNNNGVTYVSMTNHTSGATTEPGVGANWEDEWMILIQSQQFAGLDYIIDGNGYVLATGVHGPGANVRYNCEIVEATLLADQVGNIVLDIWKDTYGAYPPTNADSITGGTPLTISGGIKTTDTALTGWSTSLLTGDVLRFNVDSVAGIRGLTVGLKLQRT